MAKKKQTPPVRSMMTQITLLQVKAQTTDDALEALFKSVRNLQKHIPCLLAVAAGENQSHHHRGFTHGLILHFEDEVRMREAMTQPTYQRLLQKIQSISEQTITFEVPESIPLTVVEASSMLPAPQSPQPVQGSGTSGMHVSTETQARRHLFQRVQQYDIRVIDPRLKQLVVDQLGVDEGEIVANASLVEDLNADSLDLVEYILAVEEAFHIEIPDDDAELLTTVGEMQAYLLEKKAL